MKTVWVFGCSFSAAHLYVPVENTYGNLFANVLGYEIKNISCSGNSNDKIFLDLTNNLEKINDGDIIFFQFSSINRIGFFNDDGKYLSTAETWNFGDNYRPTDGNFKDFDEKEIETLLDYILTWQLKRKKFDLDNSLNVLNYLKITKNVKYVVLSMVDEFLNIDENTLILPIKSNPMNVSMNKYFIENKITQSDDFPDKFPTYYDTHPGISGHERIKDLLIDKINTSRLI